MKNPPIKMSYRYMKLPQETGCYLVFDRSARGFYLGRVEKHGSRWLFFSRMTSEPAAIGGTREEAVKNGMER